MLHTQPIATHLTRHNAVGKQRRPIGDPVAPLKEMTRYTPVPQPPPNHLSVSLDVFDPKASSAAVRAQKLVFHCIGDSGGIHGTATQEAVALAMENQIKTAPEHGRPAFLYHL